MSKLIERSRQNHRRASEPKYHALPHPQHNSSQDDLLQAKLLISRNQHQQIDSNWLIPASPPPRTSSKRTAACPPPSSPQTYLTSHSSLTSETSPEDPSDLRLPRAVQAVYLRPLRREAVYGVPTCDLQLRS